MYCTNCGAEINGRFCSNCGTSIEGEVKDVETCKSSVKVKAERIKNNEFVKSVREDVGNSKSLNMIKAKVKETADDIRQTDKETKKKRIVILSVLVTIVLVLIIAFGVHSCDNCGAVFFGKQYTIDHYVDESKVCSDCYGDYYGWYY